MAWNVRTTRIERTPMKDTTDNIVQVVMNVHFFSFITALPLPLFF